MDRMILIWSCNKNDNTSYIMSCNLLDPLYPQALHSFFFTFSAMFFEEWAAWQRWSGCRSQCIWRGKCNSWSTPGWWSKSMLRDGGRSKVVLGWSGSEEQWETPSRISRSWGVLSFSGGSEGVGSWDKTTKKWRGWCRWRPAVGDFRQES